MAVSSDEAKASTLKELLQSGVDQLGLKASSKQIEELVEYLLLLGKWNSTFNLSGITDHHEMVRRHLLDSLAISPYIEDIEGKLVLDIGSGAGLPGIPLAIVNPHIKFILLDSNGKKTRFLFQVKLALGLDNVSIENKRIEHYQCPEQIDIVMCRAFASLSKTVQLCSQLITGKCRLFALKGAEPHKEIGEISGDYPEIEFHKLKIPGIDGVRHLVIVHMSGQQ